MPSSYAHDCLRMHGFNGGGRIPSPDLYKMDRGGIDERRAALAKAMWIEHLRRAMEAERCAG